GFQDFINKNPWSEDLDSAIFLRDRIAFERADNSGKSDDYAYFLAAYGESQFAPLAKEKMDRTLFLEKTYNNSFIDYVNFVKSHPDSPYRGEAEDKIFQIATKTGTSEAFRNFIVEFPSNRNIKQAWKYLYNNKLQEGYSSEKIKE